MCGVALLRLRGAYCGCDDLTIFEQPESFNILQIQSLGNYFTVRVMVWVLPPKLTLTVVVPPSTAVISPG